ncbi:MAG TPA: nitronate monooxygenase, partial [Rhodothermales bacterium]
DYVLMGAGIPREIPGALDRLSENEPATLKLQLEGPASEPAEFSFNPGSIWDTGRPRLRRPRFLAIIASNSLATMLARKANGRVDGFVIEGPTAGGHNAPPRGKRELNERGEPLYGPRDEVDTAAIVELGLPFWEAGGKGRPGEVARVKAAGGAGIQVGTLFAYCRESGLTDEIKSSVLDRCRSGAIDVFTDERASPTGFPFKTVDLTGSVADGEVYASRERLCDLGYLRNAFRDESGRVDYRCPAEPEDAYVRKGGEASETPDRRCLCNSLLASIGLGQTRKDGYEEPPLVTSGDDLVHLGEFLDGRTSYSASDVVDYLLS